MSSKYYAIGAEWCGYSKKQQQTLDAMNKPEAMLMCQNKEGNMSSDLTAEQKQICEAAMPNVRGFPTWVEQKADGSVAPVEKEQTIKQGVHFVDQDRACEALPGFCDN